MSSHTNQASVTYYHLMHHFCTNNTDIDHYVANLTSTYADKSNEVSMVAASAIMFLLAGLFFNLNLFSRFSDVSAILNPKVRVFLTSALSLFLPVMSYLFSEAKNASPGASSADYGHKSELSLRADVILVWMLLVELLRKKVDEIHMSGYSSTVQRAGRVVWLGSLVFFNIKSAGRKAFFGILWILCAAKVVQRIVYTEVGKRSYAYGKNPRVISSYMSQRLQPKQHDTYVRIENTTSEVDGGGDNPLEKSQLIVVGEEGLIEEATADGYKLRDMSPTVVTIGRIWTRLNSTIDPDERFKRLCLSFALFKLLRRKFEHLPQVTKEETEECRALIFNGIYKNKEEMADAVFQMINAEVNFLSEYYHSVIPVVFASPFFFLANYLLFPVVVLGLCLMTVFLCGNGDGHYAFHHIKADNFAISSGVVSTTMCLLLKAVKSPTAFFTTVDFFVTFLLFVNFFYEEIWEFIVFLFSSWFMVSLLCNHVLKRDLRRHTTSTSNVRRILWMRRKMRKPALTFKQFSVLNIRWPLVLGLPSILSLPLLTTVVPKKAKHSIMEHLVAQSHPDSHPLSNGKSVLVGQDEVLLASDIDPLLPACDSESVAEVILTWHIATCLFEEACPPNINTMDFSKVATRLSKYCAYLVAFHPELLPDNQDKTEKVFEAVKAELKAILTCFNYYFSRWRTRVNLILNTDTEQWKDKKVVHNGAKLGKLLRDLNCPPERTWKLLADFWTELIVYVAPSDDEERIVGHEKVLVEGGEFITMLWALTTHTGITRQAKNPTAPE